MAEAGYVGTELGPPGYFGQGPEVGRCSPGTASS